MGAAVNAHSDNNFFPQLAIGDGLAIGALGGAALGAIIAAIYKGLYSSACDGAACNGGRSIRCLTSKSTAAMPRAMAASVRPGGRKRP